MSSSSGLYPTFDLPAYFHVSSCAEIPWGHAINTPQKLDAALSADIMLEADICVSDSDSSRIVMAHPPVREGELTIMDWVTRVLSHLEQHKSQKVGMKLDFKDPPAVKPSLDFLASLFDSGKLRIPLWINADILAASSRASPFNPDDFIETVHSKLPGCVLSLGWTTAQDTPYTMPQIQEMLGYCSKYQLKHVTFPMRSSLCRASAEGLHALLAADSTYTLTVWDGVEKMTRADLDWLKQTFDPSRLFLDVGEPLP